MKKVMVLTALIAGLSCAVWAERVSIVQVTDMFGKTEFQIMNAEDFAALQKEIKEETAIFPAMVAAVQKEWAADKEKKIAFPGTRVKPRQAKKLQPDFTDEAKARPKLEKLEEREMDRIVKETEKYELQLKKIRDEAKRDAFVAKENAKKDAIQSAIQQVSKKMGEKLGRPVPSFGFAMDDAPAKADAKKAEKEKAEKEKADKKADKKKAEK
ncbi:MAG: hypothetical protein J6U40_03870 [Kiritimatiellae bacterium]|nr:hypothetical protein [Kiritimatiellia bacterium]MBP5228016.1 hypothetical protein [Kiritimatiellia bacterium]